MPDNHAKLSPSSAHRWIACPGSVWLSEDAPKTTSAYAEEGTKAHEIGASCLTFDTRPDELTDDEEMAEAVAVYVNLVRAVAGMKG